MAEVKELLEMYPEKDGISIDCFSFPPPCFCPVCIDKRRAENVDITNAREVQKYNERNTDLQKN